MRSIGIVRRLAPLLALLAFGCLPDLGQYTVARDGAVLPPDTGRCDPPVTCTGGCPMPWLLAAVQDLGPERLCGGRVWRWSIGPTADSLCTCEALSAGGGLDAFPSAVGFVPPSTVVVAGDAMVVALDGTTDTLLWSAPSASYPIDMFPIENPAGTQFVVVAGANTAGSNIRSLDFYDASSGGEPMRRTVNGDLPIGLSIASVSLSPLDRRWFRALKVGTYAAADVDPWNDVLMDMPPHTPNRESFFLHTLSSSYDGRHRAVWTGERTDLGDVSEIYRYASVLEEGASRLGAGERCLTYPGGLDYEEPCDFLHAVPDPPTFSSSIAICGQGSTRRIVRVGSSGVCTTVVQQESIRPNARIWRLALAQPSFWAE